MKKISNSKVTVIIPAINEEKNIADVIIKLNKIGYDNILVIDGNSGDRTVEIAKELGANVIIQNGMGKGSALKQVFDYARLDGDLIVMMDADGSMDPKEIPMFIESLNSGVDLVKGSRFLPYGYSEDLTFIRRIGNLFFVSLVNLLWNTDYTDLCYGFAAFSKEAIEKLRSHLNSENFEIETELFIKAKKLGLNVIEIPSIEYRRVHGKSNLRTFRDGFHILKKIVKELFEKPQIKMYHH